MQSISQRLAVLFGLSLAFACGAPDNETPNLDIPEGPGAQEVPAHEAEVIDLHDLVEHETELHAVPPVGDIGTLGQPIYMPSGFGSEEGDQTRCDGSWSGGGCMVPDRRAVSFRVKTTGAQKCPPIVADQAKLALGYVIGVANSSPLSWNVTLVEDKVGSVANWDIKCNPGGSPGTTTADFSTADCHDTDRGELCQVQGGDIAIGLNSVLDLPAYVNGTQAQRQRIWNNIVRHEVGHAIGFGHKKDAPFSQLMRVSIPNAPIAGQPDAWDNLLVFDADEKHMLDCYRETSVTDPNC